MEIVFIHLAARERLDEIDLHHFAEDQDQNPMPKEIAYLN